MSLSAQISISVVSHESSAGDLSSTTRVTPAVYSSALTHGTGTDQAQVAWSDSRTIGGGGTDTLNLAALSDVRDGASATVTFTSTRAVYLKNKSAGALVFSNAAFPAGGVTVQASGVATFIAPVGTGCGVGTATVSGAVGAAYDIAIVGGGSVS